MNWKNILVFICLFFLGAFSFYALIVNADTTGDNEKAITYCNQVINIQGYPEYVFVTIVYSDEGNSIELFESSDCFGPNENFSTGIAAIKRANFESNSSSFAELQKEPKTNGSQEYNTKIDDYLVKTHAIMPQINIATETARYDIMWEIIELNDTHFELRKTVILEPSFTPSPMKYFLYIVLTAAALVIIVVFLLLRKFKKRKQPEQISPKS